MSAYLRLRWEQESEYAFLCHYELVVPLDRIDIRRDIYEDGLIIASRDELVIAMNEGPVRRTGGGTPCVDQETGKLYYDRPYRDGAHASWDSALLGNIPVKVMALDGTLIEKESE